MSESESQNDAFILEKKEISVDEDDDLEYKSIKDSDEDIDDSDSDSSDLEDFDKLKAKTTLKKLQATAPEGTAVSF